MVACLKAETCLDRDEFDVYRLQTLNCRAFPLALRPIAFEYLVTLSDFCDLLRASGGGAAFALRARSARLDKITYKKGR